MTTLYWSPEYVVAAEDFDTTRKSGWIVETLMAEPVAGIQIVPPPLLSAADLAEVHSADYIDAVRTGTPQDLAESQGFNWDPGLWTMACAHSGGVVAAALLALETGRSAGSLSSGQHHASRNSGAGFCTFNGIAIAAKRALKAGARRVLILDVDAHGAGGTHSLIEDDDRIWQIDVAVNPFESYTPRRPNTYEFVHTAARYLPTLTQRLEALASRRERFDLCIYYAGMDPYEDCRIGGLPGINRQMLAMRERLVFDWCRQQRIPVAFSIAGGYTNPGFPRDELVKLHRLTIDAAGG